ncbi:hypothetical protein IJG22_01070 [Candidatus Saccharibacteria bacterium]|nr:hypothetical protein [Candidatus Saccharibacteria bacterium]
MKQSDIITIVIIAVLGTVGSFFLVNALLGNPDNAYVSFKNVEVVDASLETPDPEIFNADALNPTVEVYVGDCEDIDQDGLLSQAELVLCGRIDEVDNNGASDS